MSPYLLFGFLVAGILSVYIKPEWVERHLSGSGMIPAFKAAIFGVPLPLCSCGVIPVSTGIYRHGASKSATTSFLLSTPQTGVDSILVTYGMLGPFIAIIRPIIALITGVIGGILVQLFEKESNEPKQKVLSTVPKSSNGKLKQLIQYGFVTLPGDIGNALIVGIIIAGAIGALVPPDYLGGIIGGGILSIIILMAAGVPVYVCATASVPIAAGFIHMGASPGAALAFLIAGPATNAATFMTIYKVLGKTTAAIYIAVVAISAVVSGMFLNWIGPHISHVMPASHHLHGIEHLSPIAKLSGILVVLIVIYATYLSGKKEEPNMEKTSSTTTLRVTGMTCSHCESNVEKIILEDSGVENVIVSKDSNQAIITGQPANLDVIIEGINSSGYEAELTT